MVYWSEDARPLQAFDEEVMPRFETVCFLILFENRTPILGIPCASCTPDLVQSVANRIFKAKVLRLGIFFALLVGHDAGSLNGRFTALVFENVPNPQFLCPEL
jgi:hypothetical protein